MVVVVEEDHHGATLVSSPTLLTVLHQLVQMVALQSPSTNHAPSAASFSQQQIFFIAPIFQIFDLAQQKKKNKTTVYIK